MPLWKRALDLVCCLLGLPFLCLVIAGGALLTQLTSPGPVLFRQKRVGLRGELFYIYKLRTMHVGTDPRIQQAYLANLIGSNAPLMKMDARRDPRLIWGGWLIRALGLDELPQIINVLRGDMTIVGPRPCTREEYELYPQEQRGRFEAVPGLTGLWQVSGKNHTTFEEMIELDERYHSTKSPGLDLAIILRTVPALVAQYLYTRRCREASTPVAAHSGSTG